MNSFFLFSVFAIFSMINAPVSDVSDINIPKEVFHSSALVEKEIPRNFEKTDEIIESDDKLIPIIEEELFKEELDNNQADKESEKVILNGKDVFIEGIAEEELTEKDETLKTLELNVNPDFLDEEKEDLEEIVLKNSRDFLPTPEKVKGIYLTGYSFASVKRRTELINLIKKTELNSVVIDVQDPHGNWMFPVEDEVLQNIKLSTISLSREGFSQILAELEKAGIYTIARVTTFQDEGAVAAFPNLSLKNKVGHKWENYLGIGWLDMTNTEAWEIPLKKAVESAKIGFDEVQFDYIRFPSDGYISQISYKNLGDRKKFEVMGEFFKFLHKNKPKIKIPISIDLFGVTYAKYTNVDRDLAIGQRVIDAVKYFDYLSPMIYPSHYADGYMGYENPAKFPYAIVNKAMIDGHNMIEKHTNEPSTKSRPWLQAFNLGAVYDYAKIREQIRAVDENNGSGWILWNARNVYGQAF